MAQWVVTGFVVYGGGVWMKDSWTALGAREKREERRSLRVGIDRKAMAVSLMRITQYA